MNNAAQKLTIREATEQLTHTTDGPVTRFVIISRATELVARGTDHTVVANAVYEALIGHGFMAPDPDPYADEDTKTFRRSDTDMTQPFAREAIF